MSIGRWTIRILLSVLAAFVMAIAALAAQQVFLPWQNQGLTGLAGVAAAALVWVLTKPKRA